MVANIIMAQGVAKFFINMSFSSIYVYSSELFPTVVRYFFISNFSALCHFPKARNKRNHTHCFVLSNLNMDLPPSCPPTQLFHLFRVFFHDWQEVNLWLGLTEWQVNGSRTEIYYDWPIMSDYLNRSDSLKWPITWLIHWPTDWLVGWLTQLLREGIILCLLQFS